MLGRVKQLATDTRHVERPLRAAGAVILSSVERNFRAQGRPQPWEKLAERTRRARRRGRGRGSARILIDTASMKNAIGMKVRTEGVEVGLNKVQARRQHFGFPGGSGRGHARTPARPFLMVQREDVQTIGDIFKRHIQR